MIKLKGNLLTLTGADAEKVKKCAKEQGITVKQVVLEALAVGGGYSSFKELKEFQKAIIAYKLSTDGYSVEIPECLGVGVNDQLDAQTFELDDL